MSVLSYLYASYRIKFIKMVKIHTLKLDLDFNLINQLSAIDRFSGGWSNIERREGDQTLKQLKSIATVQSVGASTRIEGSKMTNDEVRVLIFESLKINKLEERDQQEVVGYFYTLDVISGSYQDIRISEGDIKNLHNLLMKFSEKDQWHKGDYKQQSNSVNAHYPDGSEVTIFNTSAPGFETEEAMHSLLDWYNNDNSTPPLIKSAIFVYEFLSIHPFQDGNGRLSRLLGTLLLLKQGYPWIQYVSFENEIENRKSEYYQVLMECQQHRPGESVNLWALFFLSCLNNIQEKLKQKLEVRKPENQMSPREKKVFIYIDNHPGAKSGEIAAKLSMPLPTVKRLLAEMTAGKFLAKYGLGTGTNYTTEKLTQIKRNVLMTYTDKTRSHDFQLKNKYSFIEVKKVILTPKFEWSKPDDWSRELITQQPVMTITCYNNKGEIRKQPYSVSNFNSPYYYEPVFTLNSPIHIPANLWEGMPHDNEYPIKVTIGIEYQVEELRFDIMLVYDAAIE